MRGTSDTQTTASLNSGETGPPAAQNLGTERRHRTAAPKWRQRIWETWRGVLVALTIALVVQMIDASVFNIPNLVSLLLIVAVFATFHWRHVTERHRAEEKLKLSEERYRELFENANDLLYTHDLVGNFTSVNRACVQVTGYQESELLQMSLAELVAPEHLALARQNLLHKIQQGGGATTYEVDIVARDGRRVAVEVSTRLVMDQARPIAVQGIARDISERKRAEQTLRNATLTDPLTGVYNRRGALTLAEQQLKTAHRHGRAMMVMYADLNHLKQINDTCGHAAGDDALIETARLLQETFRESDIIARMGGDEFVILAMESSHTSEETLRRRLADKLAVHNLGRHCGFPLSISLGVAHFDPAQPRTFEELLTAADERMYADKRRRAARFV